MPTGSIVAWMERSGIRGRDKYNPDYVSLHPGYRQKNYSPSASCASLFRPNFFISHAGGQKPVNELCKQLKPIKSVNQVQYGWWKRASKLVAITIVPPKANKVRSTDIVIVILALS